MHAPLLDDFMTDEQLAAELGITVRTLLRWDARGEGPPITKVGKLKLRHRPSAREWLLAKKQPRIRASAAA
jgi:predicted site-specific integrase-resolvase